MNKCSVNKLSTHKTSRLRWFLLGTLFSVAGTGTMALSPAFAEQATATIPAQLQQAIYLPRDAAELTQRCQQQIERAQHQMNVLESVDVAHAALEWSKLSLIFDEAGDVDLLGNVHPDKAMRTAAEACTLKLTPLLVLIFQNQKRYQLIKDFKPADAIDAKFRDDLLFGFEESGIALSAEKQQRFRELQQQYDQLEQEFSRNIRDNKTTVPMTEAELKGLPASYRAMLKKDDKGLYQLNFEYPQFRPFMMYADDAAARKRYLIAFYNHGTPKNLPILDQIVSIRSEIAQLFGYKSYAEYAIRHRMAANAQEVTQFLDSVRGKITQIEQRELAELQKFRQQREGAAAPKIERWDVNYYENKYKETHFKVDQEAMRQYFPAEPTIAWALDMTTRLYGVKLLPRKVPTWHEEVRYFDVQDLRSGKIISGLYLDLYPREGKYGHAAVWPVHGASSLLQRYPVAALVTNFNRQGFNAEEVRTFLHEFGHAMHTMLSETRYLDQSGTNVERDFVEAPSQMYEEWGQRWQTLRHVHDFCDQCPELSSELVDRWRAADKFGKGIHYARQLLYANYDMTLYGAAYQQQPIGAQALWQKMEAQTPLGHIEGTEFPGSFAHISGGYAAGYYGYMWSQVIALDMVAQFGEDLLNQQQGGAFRQKVLSQGGQKKGAELAREFLGRAPNPDAFFKEITGE